MTLNAKDSLAFVLSLIILNFLGPLAVFLPAPFFLFRHKFSLTSLFLLSLIPPVLFWYVAPDSFTLLSSLIHYFSLSLAALVFIRFENSGSEFKKIMIPALSIFVVVVFSVFVYSFILHGDILKEFSDKILQLNGMDESDIKLGLKFLKLTMLGAVFFSEAIIFLLNLFLFKNRASLNFRISLYKTPQFLVIAAIFFVFSANLLFFIDIKTDLIYIIYIALGFLFFFTFFVQGIAVYLMFLSTFLHSPFARFFFIVIIFMYPIPLMLGLVGILDFWFDFRKRIINSGGGKLV